MRCSDGERRARLLLSMVGEPGDRALGRAVAHSGAVAALASVRQPGEGAPGRFAATYASRLAVADPDSALMAGSACGARFICPGDLEWPTQLEHLGDSTPLGLWVRGGADLRRWLLRSVSVVGARACTAYGRHVATDLAAELAERSWTVVSGGAYGIDAAVHAGALSAGGQTVAVLACGVDVAYPKGNETLLRRIAVDGLIVSELPPGATVTKPRFLERNRVIAAATRGTVVVEAALRSGALSTAARGAVLNRHVMAVPGPVTSPMSAGCHELIRTGGASVVTDAADVLDLVGELGSDASPRRRGEERPTDELDAPTLRVLEALPARCATSADRVVVESGLSVPVVLGSLATLEEAGWAECREGRWRLAPRTRRDAPAGGGS